MRYIAGVRKGDELSFQIDHLDEDGAGVAEVDRRFVHVPFALPGERVEVKVAHLSPHRADAWGELTRRPSGSALRVAPACAAFSACGGCTLQHIEYSAQLALKTAHVARLVAPTTAVAPCVASPRTLGYRNKSKFVYGVSNGESVLGAYRPRSHALVDLLSGAGCRVMESPSDVVARALVALLREAHIDPFDERARTGLLRYVVVRSNARGHVLVCLVVAAQISPALRAIAERLRADARVVGVVANHNDSQGDAIFGARTERIAGEETITDEIAGLTVRLSATAFFQVNRDTAALIYARVVEAAGLRDTDEVIDCYAGIGILTLLLARGAKRVCGIESHPAATADAEAMRRERGADNVVFVTGEVQVELAAFSRADVIVVNPPRKGVDEKSLREIARLSPRTLVYVSCSPDSLARDLAWLVAHGFVIRAVEPYDMMPHTPHVETIAVLQRVH